MPSNYTDCISLTQALYFDLFDDINYKWLKLILNSRIDLDEYDFQVDIQDLPCDRPAYCKIKFTFDLQMEDDERWGRSYYKTKTFTKIIEYNGSSALALTLCGMVVEEEEEEEEDEEDEDEEEEDEGNTEAYKSCCVNLHYGGQFGCDLCCDKKDEDNTEMLKEWLDKNNKYSYKLHKKWLDNKEGV